MATLSKEETKPASLVREAKAPQGHPGMVRVGERMARGLRTLITNVSPAFPVVAAQPARVLTFRQWRADQAAMTGICRFGMAPLKGAALAVIPPKLVAQLVDCFYGGSGDVAFDRADLSKGEQRFLERMGEMLIEVIAAAWADNCALTPSLLGVETETGHIAFVKDDDLVVVQALTINGAPFGSAAIEFVYGEASLRPVKGLSEVSEPDEAPGVDVVWRDRLQDAIMQVRLPVRTIFARTELPLTRLLCLKTGDMIPICLPTRVPVTIGGRNFAEGTVGESNGRASIRIEKLEEGIFAHD
jgi:flagellar motor switch protein FliM